MQALPIISEFEPQGKNKDIYLASYNGPHSKSHKDDWPILKEMIKDGSIKVVEKSRKNILYQYIEHK